MNRFFFFVLCSFFSSMSQQHHKTHTHTSHIKINIDCIEKRMKSLTCAESIKPCKNHALGSLQNQREAMSLSSSMRLVEKQNNAVHLAAFAQFINASS